MNLFGSHLIFGAFRNRETTPRPAAGRDGEHGFTLVEMLVVITIIGLVMGLIGPRVLNLGTQTSAHNE
jgi:prepilin-type N-terminal cleavage/methylation domain-containing protein